MEGGGGGIRGGGIFVSIEKYPEGKGSLSH
jgi:hypothetical protein